MVAELLEEEALIVGLEDLVALDHVLVVEGQHGLDFLLKQLF